MWRDQFLAASGNDKESFPFACVGSKCDVASQRAVSQRRANTWCAANGDIPYFECSAKDATNVRLCFMTLARKAVKKMQQERAAENAASVHTSFNSDAQRMGLGRANRLAVSRSQRIHCGAAARCPAALLSRCPAAVPPPLLPASFLLRPRLAARS